MEMMADWGSYMLGREAERSEKKTLELAEQLAARFQGRRAADVSTLQRENAGLRQELARNQGHIADLERQIGVLKQDYARLREWGDVALGKLRLYEAE